MMKRLYSVIVLLLYSVLGYAGSYHYKYSENCHKAYTAYMSLQPQTGDAYIKNEFLADPYNLLATYINDYNDGMELLMNGGKEDYEQRKNHLSERLKLLERGDATSPWHRYCKAGLYMHWAFVQVRFGDNLKSAANFRKSFLLLKENKRLFPSFEYNNVFLGIEEAAVGALPDDYKWIASIFGMKGNMKSGAQKLNHFLNTHQPDDPLYNEALIYNIYLHFYVTSDKEKAWQLVNSRYFDTKDNLLNSFVKANIALNYKKASVAEKVLLNASTIDGYRRYAVFEYQYAYVLLHQVNDRAIQYFKSYIQHTKGQMFVKDSYQKIAYLHYLDNDEKAAAMYKSAILNKGNASTDADKQAQRFAESNKWPDKILLKVQLLTDGGDINRAFDIIDNYSENNFQSVPARLEYHYRLAKLLEEKGNETLAMQHYRKAIEMGKDRQEQFGARAALQLGLMYEEDGDHTNAKAYYMQALAMKNHDFKNSIDQQAKAGLNRLP